MIRIIGKQATVLTKDAEIRKSDKNWRGPEGRGIGRAGDAWPACEANPEGPAPGAAPAGFHFGHEPVVVPRLLPALGFSQGAAHRLAVLQVGKRTRVFGGEDVQAGLGQHCLRLVEGAVGFADLC